MKKSINFITDNTRLCCFLAVMITTLFTLPNSVLATDSFFDSNGVKIRYVTEADSLYVNCHFEACSTSPKRRKIEKSKFFCNRTLICLSNSNREI